MPDAMTRVASLTVGGAVIGAEDDERWAAPLQRCEEGGQLGIDIGERGLLGGGTVFCRAIGEDAIWLMQRGDVDKEEKALVAWEGVERVDRLGDLVTSGIGRCDPHLNRPVAFGKQIGQHATEWRLLVKKPNPANTDRVVAIGGQSAHDVRCIKHNRFSIGRFAAGKASGKVAWMATGCKRGRQKAREKGVMRGIGEAARCVPRLPTSGEIALQKGRFPRRQRAACHVEPQGVERHKEEVVLLQNHFNSQSAIS